MARRTVCHLIKQLKLISVVSICGGKTILSCGSFTSIQLKHEQRDVGFPKVSLYPRPNWRKSEKRLSELVSDLRLSLILSTQVLRGKKLV